MPGTRQLGKLVVILHADIAGSTTLVQQDEHLAHERIQDTFRRFSDFIARYQGQVRELRGDALLAEFARASDAVSATLSFQASQAEYIYQLNDNILPGVRVGIAMGEVIVADNTVTGEGVVLAQRVEQIAEPGGVCITGAIHEALPRRMPFDQDDLGEQEVKGFDEPIRVYAVRLKEGATLPDPTILTQTYRTSAVQWVMGVAVVVIVCGGGLLAWLQPWKPDFEPAFVEKMALPLPDKPSIAVLPFDNYSDEKELGYFADGITENITSALSKAPGLFVIARNSAATYKGKSVNVKQVAEDLGVQYVLEGSVQKSGDQLRITAQLVDAIKGHHLWTDRFDRHAGDVFAIQDEITKRVFTELQVELTEGEHARMAAGGTDNLDAWLLRIEAYSEYIKFTQESQIRARELYEAAHEADPSWAFPVAGIGFTHWYEARRGWGDSRDESIRLGVEAAEQAIELQPNEPIGYMALGNLMFLTGELDQAIEYRRKAIELAPNAFTTVGGLAVRLSEANQEQEAIELFERAIRLSPKHPWWIEFGYGLALHLVGRREDAVEVYKQGINTGTGGKHAPLHARLAAVYADLGRTDEAKAKINEVLRLNPKFTAATYQKSYPFPTVERNNWYKDLLVQAGLPEHPPLELPEKPSIAVLPFTNMSDDPEQEYFVDGMTEDLITDLSKISGLFVIARNSSFTYKGKVVDVKNVARDLGVRYVLEGSVRRAGEQVRINAQLIDATTGGHLWADRYDGPLDNVFALQDQVTQEIVSALEVNLTRGEETQWKLYGTKNAEAHDAYLQGWAHYKLLTPGDLARSLPFFEEAIRLDPNYTQAHAALASVYWDAYRNDWAFDLDMPSTRAENRANEHLEEALKEPTPLAHALGAKMMASFGFYDQAVIEAEKAVALDTNEATAHAGLADALVLAGRPSEAFEFIQTAMRLDPHHPPDYLTILGAAQFGMESYEEATATFERAVKRNPKNEIPLIYLASSYGHLGRIRKAEDTIEDANDLRASLGLGDLSLERKSPSAFSPFQGEIDFVHFGGRLAQERLRAGLSKIPALTWQYLITVHEVPSAGNTWFEVKGATQVDLDKAKSLYDQGAVFIDVSYPDAWKEQRIPRAIQLNYNRSAGTPKTRLTEESLMAVADKDEEIVMHCHDQACDTPARGVAKAVNWGFQKVFFFTGGAPAWKEAGYAVDEGE